MPVDRLSVRFGRLRITAEQIGPAGDEPAAGAAGPQVVEEEPEVPRREVFNKLFISDLSRTDHICT